VTKPKVLYKALASKIVQGNGVGMNQNFRLGTCVLVLSFLVIGCGKKLSENELPRPSARLVHDTQNFPGVVMISGQQLCTGTVVGPSTILTASHCINQNSSITVQTSVGPRVVTQVLKLGAGVEGDQNDLAILYLATPLPSNLIIPVASGVNRGDLVSLVGFGCNHSDSAGPGGIKRAGVNVVSDISDFIEVTTPQLNIRAIAGPENRAGVCFGDSGGPLLKQHNGQWAVVGVTHGAYNDESSQVSQFVDLHQPANRAFVSSYVR